MICNDCKYERCPVCKGTGERPVREGEYPIVLNEDLKKCANCRGEKRIMRPIESHQECIKRNEGKEVADCDCQHKLNHAGSRS